MTDPYSEKRKMKERIMTKRLQKNIALACAVCLFTMLLCGYAVMDYDLPVESERVTYDKVAVSVTNDLRY